MKIRVDGKTECLGCPNNEDCSLTVPYAVLPDFKVEDIDEAIAQAKSMGADVRETGSNRFSVICSNPPSGEATPDDWRGRLDLRVTIDLQDLKP